MKKMFSTNLQFVKKSAFVHLDFTAPVELIFLLKFTNLFLTYKINELLLKCLIL